MLKRRTSLKLRAAAIFIAVFGLVIVPGFVLVAWRSLSTGGERHHAGPTMALSFAAGQVDLVDGSIRIAAGGPLARLARSNPSLWLLGESNGQRYTFGAVPEPAASFVGSHADVLENVRFHVAGVARPLSDASVTRYGSVVLAAGGIDPSTVSLLDTVDYTVEEGLLPMLLGLGLVGLIAMLVALPLLTRALAPVISDALAIQPGAPGRRLREHKVPSELLPLVHSFNAALDRLADELGRRKRFVADVAHELRTPLAILSLQVEAMEQGEGRAEMSRVVARMSHLVAQMLDVERLSLSQQRRSPLDLVALSKEVIAELAPMAIAAGYELSLDAPGMPVCVEGDPHALNRALTNLVANAVAHGGGSGEIRVLVCPQRTVEVIDAGPGVAPAIRPRLFEPFCRERWDRDGCGLGLHLTREIMRAHGGDAELLDSASGARFRLRFPPRSANPPGQV